MLRHNKGDVRDVARSLGGTLVAPLLDPTSSQRYFGHTKGFRAVDELVTAVTGDIPVSALATGQTWSMSYMTVTTEALKSKYMQSGNISGTR